MPSHAPRGTVAPLRPAWPYGRATWNVVNFRTGASCGPSAMRKEIGWITKRPVWMFATHHFAGSPG
jgi:hypothetical protein